MPDDKTKTGAADRRQVAGGEDYEVEAFARKHGINTVEAKTLINRHGNDRATLEAAVARWKKGTG